MLSLPLIASALIIGLLGAGHCIGMCGGLMGALTMAIPPEHKAQRFKLLLGYNLGRVSSYGIAGVLFGLGGWALQNSPLALGLRIFAALLLIAMGLYLAGWWFGLNRLERAGQHLWRYIQPLTKRLLPVTSLPKAILLGALWGWLPCGLVYSTLIWSASQGNALHSGLLMVLFGLGTWPVLIISGLAAEQLKQFLQRQAVRMFSGLLLILFGLWTLPGPHQMWLMGH